MIFFLEKAHKLIAWVIFFCCCRTIFSIELEMLAVTAGFAFSLSLACSIYCSQFTMNCNKWDNSKETYFSFASRQPWTKTTKEKSTLTRRSEAISIVPARFDCISFMIVCCTKCFPFSCSLHFRQSIGIAQRMSGKIASKWKLHHFIARIRRKQNQMQRYALMSKTLSITFSLISCILSFFCKLRHVP